MIDKSVVFKLNEVMNIYKLGIIIDIELLHSSQNKVYKVYNGNKNYVIKEFSKDAINSYYTLRRRKEQLNISNVLNDNGIKTAMPLANKDKYFTLYKDFYYVIYDFLDKKPLTEEELTIKHVEKLALTQSKIHKLDIDSNLPCSYKKISIDLDKYLKRSKKIDDELYQCLLVNINSLVDVINKCNNYIKNMKKNLCISHNDYKLLNVLWNNNNMTLIDFDATGLSNPTCSLCESAFTFSRYNGAIRYKYYEAYLKAYLKNYGVLEDDFKEALYVSFNGKLQWLSYMMSKNHLKKDNYVKDTISMINELVLYYNNIEMFNYIYLSIVDK